MKVVLQETSSKHVPSKVFLLCVLVPVLIVVGIEGWIQLQYQGKYLPGVHIDDISVSGLTKSQARTKLEQTFSDLPESTVQLEFEGLTLAESSSELELSKVYDHVIDQAFLDGRSESILQNAVRRLSNLVSQRRYFSTFLYNDQKLAEFVQDFNVQVETPSAVPAATIVESAGTKTVAISDGQIGRQVDIASTVQEIQAKAMDQDLTITPKIVTKGKVLDENTKQQAIEKASLLLNKHIVLQADINKVTIPDSILVTFLDFPKGYQEENIREEVNTLASQFNREAQDAEFVYDTRTLKVKTFAPHLEGRTLNLEKNIELVKDGLNQLVQEEKSQQIVELAFEKTAPNKTLADVNDLGIDERIGFGESFYGHSIPTRIHNVSNAANIINNYIVAPGQEFSFNQALGEVSKRTGFQPAYVISGGQTVLGDGGGVCQVSTTLFRALLDSGLQITRRLPHSYRVSYYEINNEPGYDATVYSGNVDLRFVNDTDHHVLLHFTVDSKNTYMNVQLFGTSDGRTAEVTNYQKWGARGAPAPVYFDDPTLPAGKLVQVDWAVGGIRTKFTHTVKDKDGNVISQKDYTSNYIPWSAKYRRGTGN